MRFRARPAKVLQRTLCFCLEPYLRRPTSALGTLDTLGTLGTLGALGAVCACACLPKARARLRARRGLRGLHSALASCAVPRRLCSRCVWTAR